MAIDKITNPAQAANLYANTAKAAGQPGLEGAATGGFSFGDLLKSGLQSAIGTVKAGEAASAAAVAGKADLSQVVQAINQAELTLQTVVAIRDRMLSAYQEILRMPI